MAHGGARKWKRFNPRRFPRALTPDRHELHRGSAHDRGYDYRWQVLATRYRLRHPFCERCQQRGHDGVLADVVDHMVPVRSKPEYRLRGDMIWSLCHHCHNGWKARIEAYAERAGLLDMLPTWCREPDSRPPGFKT